MNKRGTIRLSVFVTECQLKLFDYFLMKFVVFSTNANNAKPAVIVYI